MPRVVDGFGSLLYALSARRPLCHSEADLQHELAWELRASGIATAVRLGRPFDIPDGVINLDIAAGTGAGTLAIELK